MASNETRSGIRQDSMTLFANLAALSEALAGESSRLKKRAAVAAAVAAVAGRSMPQERNRGTGQPDHLAHFDSRSQPEPRLQPESRRQRDSRPQRGSFDVHAVEDAGLFCLYLAGQPFAEADPRRLNAGGALLTRVLKQVSGCTDAALTAAYRRHGDLGSAAFDLLMSTEKQEPALTLDAIATVFGAMAAARTTAKRAAQVEGLLRRATALEAKYLMKLILGDMRIGVKQSLIEEAIAVAAGTEVNAVRHAVMLEGDLSNAVRMAFAGQLATARMRLFHPLGFMLASPVGTSAEAIARFTEKPVQSQTAKTRKKYLPKKKKSADLSEQFGDLGEVEGVEPEDAAEEGLAEDVESEAAGERAAALSASGQKFTRIPANNGPGLPSSGREGIVMGAQAFLEDKYDGMRAQLHCGDPTQIGRVAIYSRNREDITQSFPEIEEAFREVKRPLSGPLILDGELLGWDFHPSEQVRSPGTPDFHPSEQVRSPGTPQVRSPGTAEVAENKALPFSMLGQRFGRKRVDNKMRRQVPVVFMAFDLLFEDGDLLLPLPLRERRARLEGVVDRLTMKAVSPIERDERADEKQRGLFTTQERVKEPPVQRLMISPAKLVESAEEIDRAYANARARANEGVMLKAAGSPYLPGRRGLAWVKLKRELGTLDVVITGAEFGHGRRAGLLSDYTFAVQGSDGELLNVGKAYSGVTDAEIAELTEWLKAHTLEDYGHFRTVEPLRVIEVTFNNVMRSEYHESGFSLRFPRILRIRDDKSLSEIDTLERVEEIYQSQPDKGEDREGPPTDRGDPFLDSDFLEADAQEFNDEPQFPVRGKR